VGDVPEVVFDEHIESVVAAAERMATLVTDGTSAPPPAARPVTIPGSRGDALAMALELDPDELDLVWSIVARAVDPRVGAHLRAVFGNEPRVGLSIAQHAALRELPPVRTRALLRVIDPRHPLRRHGIIELASETVVDISAPWTSPARVWSYLQGDDEIDATVASLGGVVAAPEEVLLSSEQAAVREQLGGWLGRATTIVLEGPTGSGRRTAVALAAADRRVISLDFARVGVREAAAALTALRREVLLSDAIPVLANLDELWSKLAPSEDLLGSLARTLDGMTGPVVVTTSTPGLDLRPQLRTVVRAIWPIPDIATRRALWDSSLGTALAPDELDLVAQRYEIGAGGIVSAVRSAIHRASHRGVSQPTLSDLTAGVQDNISERLGELARRVVVRQDWSELVLVPETLDDVRALLGRVRHAHFVLEGWGFKKKLARGTGVAALFSGPPGTGKTMVAGLIARELQLELYQVDLSRIVSKWVGETEKQLAKLFEAAEAGHALLLFDEADSLFAKRSAEVKSATDRYANLEVNYLLQRIESFGGVAILTTNLDTSIDPALKRRLASHIVFGAPDLDERTRLWREMLDTGAPVDQAVNCHKLADEFSAMSGANIRNAVLSAAFLAAEEGTTITFDVLRRAARGEYRSMGHVLGRDHRTTHSRL